MKRILAVLCCVCLLAALAVNVWAFPASGQLGDDVTYVIDAAAKTLYVNGSGATWDFTTEVFEGDGEPEIPVPYPVFYKNDLLAPAEFQTVVIQEGITYLGESLFEQNNDLRAVLVPASVERLGAWAFECRDRKYDLATHTYVDYEVHNQVFFYGNAPEEDVPGAACSRNTTFYYLPGAEGWGELKALNVYNLKTFCGAPFGDVRAGKWYSEAIRILWERGIISGVRVGEFGLGTVLNRAMTVTMLYKLAGDRLPAGQAQSFRDVPKKAYYAEALRWAASNGIVTGYPDGSFRPNEPITRAELVTMLYKLALLTGLAEPGQSAAPAAADWKQVPAYARPAFAWAYENGVVSGTSQSPLRLSPKGETTREQAAVILARMLSLFEAE